MAYFFTLLPADLQRHIFQTWLAADGDGPLLRLLSAVDIACCNASIRDDFLYLLSQLPFQWTRSGRRHWGMDRTLLKVKRMSSCISWLSSRGVKVASLSLSEKNLADLRFANGRPLRSDAHVRENCAAALAKVSKTIANVEYSGSSVANLLDLLAYGLPLKRLHAGFIANFSRFPTSTPAEPRDLRRLYAFFVACDIEELYITEMTLTLELSAALQRCRCLRILELHALHVSTATIVQLLQGCKTIEVLSLDWYDGTEEDVSSIMQAGRHQLKAFEMTGGWEAGFPFHIFALLLSRYRWLERIKVGICIFDQAASELAILVDGSTPGPFFDAVVECCSLVKKLIIQQRGDNTDFLSTLPALSQAVVDNTEELTIQLLQWSPDTVPLLKEMVLQCTLLRTLKLNIPLTDEDVLQIADSNSQYLRHIEIRKFYTFLTQDIPQPVTDVAIGQLLFQCRHLRVLHIDSAPDVTYLSLLSALCFEARLEAFSWRAIGFSNEDADKFRINAKSIALFPAPRLFQENAQRRW